MIIACVISVLAVFIAFQSNSDWRSVLGVSLACFWFLMAGLVMYPREKRQIDGLWFSRILVGGLFIRILAGFLHLMVGYLFYEGMSDYTQYHTAGYTMFQRMLEGQFIFVEENPDKFDFRLIDHLMALSYFAVGPGVAGMVVLFALCGFFGSYLFLKAFRLEFQFHKNTRLLALGLFFLPSFAFWGSYPGKDCWVILFLGWATYSFSRVIRKFDFINFLGICISLTGLFFLRYPVAGATAIAMATAWPFRQWKGPIAIFRPVIFAVYPAIVVAIVMFMGSYYIQKTVNLITDPIMFVEETVQTGVTVHEGYTGASSSRNVEITNKTVGGIFSYLPKGIFAFLFRPSIMEAHHTLALFAALEATFFLTLVIWRWSSIVAAMRMLFKNSFILLCATTFFTNTLFLALETNFGTIVRHRAMVIPFLLILMAVPSDRKHIRIFSNK